MNTMQFEFDAVVAHLYAQGRPAKTFVDGGIATKCYYRTAGGLECAVGCRIPDDVYVPEMDKNDANGQGTSLNAIIMRFADVLPKELMAYSAMFNELQSVHDYCKLEADGTFNLQLLSSNLAKVAETYHLTFTVPEAE